MQLEDLLMDELAGSGLVCAWECTLQALFLKSDPSALSRIKRITIKSSLPLAVQNLEAWIAQACNIGAINRIDPNSELPKLLAGLKLVERAYGVMTISVHEAQLMQQSMNEMLDEEVFGFLGHQDRFYRQIALQLEQLDVEQRQMFKASISELESGLSDVGIARSDALRKSRTEATAIAESGSADFCTAVALVAALANWKLTRGLDETKRLLRRAWGRAQRESDAISWPIARFLGHLELMDSDLDLAWSALSFAAEKSNDCETIVDATRLAIHLRKWDQARALIQKGLRGNGLFVIRILACTEMIEIVGDILEALALKQRETRQEIGLELSTWNNDTNRIKQAGKKAESALPFIYEMDSRRKQVAGQIARADLFSAIALVFQARNARHEAIRLANQQLGSEYSEAVKKLEFAQGGIDRAWLEREAMIEAAIARQTDEVQIARQALHSSLKESEKNQSGCVVAMGSGCGAFVLYLFIAGILTTQGVSAGFGTIFGWFGLAASGIPILIAVVSQVAYGAQRSALDKALHDKIKLAQVAYEIAAKRADRYYREQVLNFKQGLEEVETRAKKLEESLEILNAGNKKAPLQGSGA